MEQFSDHYHKARRQLMLWSGILFAWALVGIDLEKLATEGTGNLGDLAKTIQSPQAAPWVLVILVLYFSFRFSVEWLQGDTERRSLRVSRVDMMLAFSAAAGSLVLYLGQLVAEVRIADTLSTDKDVTVSIIAGMLLPVVWVFLLQTDYHWGRRPWLGASLSVGWLLLVGWGLYLGVFSFIRLGLGFAVGATILVLPKVISIAELISRSSSREE